MRMLYITPSFQHPLVRGPHRHYYFIKELSKRHKITLLALARDEIAGEAMEEMRQYTEAIFTFDVNGSSRVGETIGRLPVVGGRMKHLAKMRNGIGEMRTTFKQLMARNDYDVVLFHGKSLFPVIRDWNSRPIVADFCDATSMRIKARMQHVGLPQRFLLYYQYRQFSRIERELLGKTEHVAFISNRDRQAVADARPGSVIIPIGVDHQFWRRNGGRYRPNCIAFTGVMDYGPNHDAAMRLIDQILPQARKKIPDLQVLIVGRSPRPELQERGDRVPGVTVTGFVNDLRPYLEQAAIFAAPLRYASGIQNKVLEAMAMKVPVVTTSCVADGLYMDGCGEAPVTRADDDGQFVQSLVGLLSNIQERDRLAEESRRFVELHFNWRRSAEILENLCTNAVNGNATNGAARDCSDKM